MSRASDKRLLAAPMLGERGGGIGQVSELLWESMRDTWPASADVVTLLGNGHVVPHAADKVRFGVAFARRRLMAPPAWTLFSHLRLARIEGYLPAGLRAPYAVFLHGIEAWKPLRPQEQKAVRDAALRIANSHFTARAVAAANPGIGDIAVCPLALPKGMALPAKAARQAPDARTVLMVGRLSASERYKGHEPLIRAWPGVVARVPDARLVIVGDGDDAARLARLAADSGAGGTVRFSGFLPRPELEAEYARAALFALPSRGEGFGLVYLEAMAHGLACLGSRHDAASEVIEGGTTGVLVDPDDVEALGRAVADLLESPFRRRAMGEAGRARVAAMYQYDRFRQQIVGLLRAGFPEMGEA
jgi:phosphatidyl-myo-inositol dimannoside synthase